MSLSIVKINDSSVLEPFTHIIRTSFGIVAEEYGLTEVDSPTNPAFIKFDNLKKTSSLAECFGIYIDNTPCGFFAIEFNKDNKSIYLERVCVIPESRHNGIGRSILIFTEEYSRAKNIEKISIGIMNQNSILKKWYIQNGYNEVSIKKFPHIKFEVCFLEKYLK